LRRWSAELSEATHSSKGSSHDRNSVNNITQSFGAYSPSPIAAGNAGIVLVAGTMDTKAAELRYVRDILRRNGLTARLADLSLRSSVTGADIPSHEIATIDTNTQTVPWLIAWDKWLTLLKPTFQSAQIFRE
jgi:hypothetical protein